MNGSTDAHDDARRPPHTQKEPTDRPRDGPTTPGPGLRLTVVTHETGPDRGTIHPPGLTGIARMETWLSVDRDALVDLGAWR
ncbi:MAG: hypothetical protein ABEK02_01885 [Haloquadratum sp.]